MTSAISQLATRVFVCICCALAWFACPIFVVSIRESEGGCVDDASLFAGSLLRESSAFMDALLVATKPANTALRGSTGLFIFCTFLTMAWTAAANSYVAYTACVAQSTRYPLAPFARAFCACMLAELFVQLLCWLPPAAGFTQPGTVYYYYPLGLTAACSGQLFCGRFAWASFVTFRFCDRKKRERHHHHRSYTIIGVLSVVLGLCYLLGTRQIYGMGALNSTVFATWLCCDTETDKAKAGTQPSHPLAQRSNGTSDDMVVARLQSLSDLDDDNDDNNNNNHHASDTGGGEVHAQVQVDEHWDLDADAAATRLPRHSHRHSKKEKEQEKENNNPNNEEDQAEHTAVVMSASNFPIEQAANA